MKVYQRRTVVKAPFERVIEFHYDLKAFKKLSPPFMFMRVQRAEPISEGSVMDFRMWLGPIPIRWIAVHKDVVPGSEFSDYQEKGPFKSWEHQHIFRAIDSNTTEVIDLVQAEMNEHFFWGIVSRFMWINMPILFSYRGWALRKELENIE